MSYCPFCEIVYDDPHGQIEWISADSVMIAPLEPVTPGHKLFIPLLHVPNAASYPELTARVMCDAARHAQKIDSDCNIITSVGPAATQTVFHLHIHVVPRSPDDGLALPWTSA